MSGSLVRRVGYAATHIAARFFAILAFRIRVHGRRYGRPSVGGLVCSNHQSYLDPVLVGLALDRRLNYLARASLFRNALFRKLIEFYDAIPIDRERNSFAGLRETLDRLKRDELVLIFPEGTRTETGKLQPLKPGFCSVARRSGKPLFPVAIAGAYEAWPRTQWLPTPAVIDIVFGEPIAAERIGELTDEELLKELAERLAASFQEACQYRKRANLEL